MEETILDYLLRFPRARSHKKYGYTSLSCVFWFNFILSKNFDHFSSLLGSVMYECMYLNWNQLSWLSPFAFSPHLPSSFTIIDLFFSFSYWALIRLQYTINAMVYCLITYFQAGHPSCLILRELTKTGFTAIRLNKIAEFFIKLNWRNARICKTYFLMDVINVFRSICKKQHLLISWKCAKK